MKIRVAFVLAIGLPTLVLLALGLAVFRPGLPPSAQAVLEAYLAWRSQATSAAWQAVEAVQADQPTRLQATWSTLTFSTDPYYLTSLNDDLASYQSTQANGSHIGPADSRRPLPYPPLEAWCIRLRTGEPSQGEVVLLALHQDLYNAAWIVHELALPAADEAPDTILAALGCAVAP